MISIIHHLEPMFWEPFIWKVFAIWATATEAGRSTQITDKILKQLKDSCHRMMWGKVSRYCFELPCGIYYHLCYWRWIENPLSMNVDIRVSQYVQKCMTLISNILYHFFNANILLKFMDVFPIVIYVCEDIRISNDFHYVYSNEMSNGLKLYQNTNSS